MMDVGTAVQAYVAAWIGGRKCVCSVFFFNKSASKIGWLITLVQSIALSNSNFIFNFIYLCCICYIPNCLQALYRNPESGPQQAAVAEKKLPF